MALAFGVIGSPRQDDPRFDTLILEKLLDLMDVSSLGGVVILGSGDGQWNQVVDTQYITSGIKSYLWWDKHERPALKYHNKTVEIITKDVAKTRPIRFDTLLCNVMQPNHEHELEDLKTIEKWLRSVPTYARSIFRITNHTDQSVVRQLNEFYHLEGGILVGFVDQDDLVALYYVISPNSSISSKVREANLADFEGCTLSGNPNQTSWQIPGSLPVEHLAPLDMGATIEGHLNLAKTSLNKPLNQTRFYKEIGWYAKKFTSSSGRTRHEPTIERLIEPLFNLIKPSEWLVTNSEPRSLNKTLMEKYDRQPQENHGHYHRLWEAYQGIAEFLISKDIRLPRLSHEEVEEGINKRSSIGFHDKQWGFSNLGEFVDEPSKFWRKLVKEFKASLLAGRPIKADFFAFGKREVKKEDKTRMVFSTCATVRLYESLVVGKVDELLEAIPFSMIRLQAHNNGELFHELMYGLDDRRVAICDDISAWDTRVSYSKLCLEAAFLKLLADDEHHKEEIESLYRLYAFALVNIPRELDGERQQIVMYQVQGQVQSGRRVTYAMNTITNMVVNMCRAAKSQGVSVEATKDWVVSVLNEGHSARFGGKICGDDSVILLGPEQAKLFAEEIELVNDLGLRRKVTDWGPSKILYDFAQLNFCSRNYVQVPMYDEARQVVERRYIPVKRVDEILIRKLKRISDHLNDNELPMEDKDWAWVREQGRDLLVEYFYFKTVRLLALVILSVTPRNIILEGNRKGWSEILGHHFTVSTIVDLLNKRLFGEDAHIKSTYRAKRLADFGFMSDEDAKIYELDMKHDDYENWVSGLLLKMKSLQLASRQGQYDDWVQYYDPYLEDPLWRRVRLFANMSEVMEALPTPDKSKTCHLT